ncbi:MAG: hypothetical protein Q8M70_06680, partial [bacterium]|nr:hypothetical protein [bacterium]
SIITAGIYGFIWQMMVLDRWNSYIQRNRGVERISIVGYLLWVFLGSLIIIGPIVAAYKYLHSMNDVARIYNTKLVNAR